MSIQRIESAYAECMKPKWKVNGTDMAVLIALAYCDNRENGCFPAYEYLSLLTHFNDRTVRMACRRLKEMGLINWKSGGFKNGRNVANVYTFKFDYQKVLPRRDLYGLLNGETEGVAAPAGEGRNPIPPREEPNATMGGTQCRPVRNEMPPREEPNATPGGTKIHPQGNQIPTNSEANTEKNIKLKLESNSKELAACFDVKNSSRRTSSNGEKTVAETSTTDRENRNEAAELKQRASNSILQDAMRVTRTKDVNDYKTFTICMFRLRNVGLSEEDIFEIINTLESEIKAGEHEKARNLPSILTQRFVAIAKERKSRG